MPGTDEANGPRGVADWLVREEANLPVFDLAVLEEIQGKRFHIFLMCEVLATDDSFGKEKSSDVQ